MEGICKLNKFPRTRKCGSLGKITKAPINQEMNDKPPNKELMLSCINLSRAHIQGRKARKEATASSFDECCNKSVRHQTLKLGNSRCMSEEIIAPRNY